MPSKKIKKSKPQHSKIVAFVINLLGGTDEATTSMKVITFSFGLLSIFATLWYVPKYFIGYTSICTETGDPNPTLVDKNIKLFIISVLAALISLLLLIGLKKYKSWAYVSASLFFFILFGLMALIIFHIHDPNFLCGFGTF